MRNEYTHEQEVFLEALEGGKYAQGSGRLWVDQVGYDGVTLERGYCCLGVATNELLPSHKSLDALGEPGKQMSRDQYPPEEVWEGLLMYSNEGLIHWALQHHVGHNSLAAMNDNSVPFARIVHMIRKYPWGVFSNFDRGTTHTERGQQRMKIEQPILIGDGADI